MIEYGNILHLLKCPSTGSALRLEGRKLISVDDDDIQYDINNNIIRFTEEGVKLGYNEHWNKYGDNKVSDIKIKHGQNFIEWLFFDLDKEIGNDNIIIDIGCGDGNHIPHLPEKPIKIVVDFSSAVDVVAERYAEKVKNLYIIQADANCLPINDTVADYVYSYSCFNTLPNVVSGVNEALRILLNNGTMGVWGYGTSSKLIYNMIKLLRKAYHVVDNKYWHSLMSYSLIPSLLLIKNSTKINPIKNSLRECAEIISTNLSPENLHIFHKETWKEFVNDRARHVGDYEVFCGQKFIK